MYIFFFFLIRPAAETRVLNYRFAGGAVVVADFFFFAQYYYYMFLKKFRQINNSV